MLSARYLADNIDLLVNALVEKGWSREQAMEMAKSAYKGAANG